MLPLDYRKVKHDHPDFVKLVKLLNQSLKITDGDLHEYYNQYNHTDTLDCVIVAYYNDEAIACGAFRSYDDYTVEIKRMYVVENQRGKGVASSLLRALELNAADFGFTSTVLETGVWMHDAIALYKKNGYQVIPNYDQYAGMDSSVCFGKSIHKI